MIQVHDIAVLPLHLGLGARAEPQPPFTGMEWYEAYAARTAADGAEGRLVSMHTFTKSWDMWEQHPEGDEVVLCLQGSIKLIQEAADGSRQTQALCEGQYVVNPAGVWHTADVSAPATALFITAGSGTRHRPR